MDGGLDLAIRDVLGFSVQGRAQRVIVERNHGERGRRPRNRHTVRHKHGRRRLVHFRLDGHRL